MNWIDSLLQATDEIETPRSYIRWAGMAAISAVVKKNVYFDRSGFWKVYPNLYIMLYGPSGITKSYATNLSKNLVKLVNNTRIIEGQNSIEGILQELATAKTDKDGHVAKYAHAFVVANELTNLLIDNPQAFGLLTELYDAIYNEEWPKRLKSGTIKLLDPCITMITATNKAHFDNKIKSVDIEGGFMGRTMVIAESRFHRINPLIRKGTSKIKLDEFTGRLREISEIRGEFEMADEDAYKSYENWYVGFKKEIEKDDTGTLKRIPDHILKIAMINSLAEKNELILTKDDVERAIEICTQLTVNTRKITAGSGTSPNSNAMIAFIQTLIGEEGNRLEHALMLRKNIGNFDVNVCNLISETLVQSGVIEIHMEGSKTFYVLSDKAREMYVKEGGK